MSEWKPIETAPRDRVIDLWAGGKRWTDCQWGRVDYKNEPAWGRDGGYANEHGFSGRVVEEVRNPTHWMDIPAPPA